METHTSRQSALGIPGAIIIAATIIAVALIYVLHPASTSAPSTQKDHTPAQAGMAPVTTADHILGDPNAPIKIVEYSDPSCPFCKMFNPTMEQIINDYGPSGKVAWVYRSFPLDKPDANGNVLHPNAGHEAQALECAGFLGGNEKFWSFEKTWYDSFPLQGATDRDTASDTAQLLGIAKTVGIDPLSFSDCLSSGQFKSKVEAQYLDGINAGVSGTPFSIIVPSSGSPVPLEGGVSYPTLKTAIDTLLDPQTP